MTDDSAGNVASEAGAEAAAQPPAQPPEAPAAQSPAQTPAQPPAQPPAQTDVQSPAQPPGAHASHLYQYVHHQRRRSAPVKVEDQLKRDSPVSRFNAKLAVVITKGVGTMWCAYLFTAIALVGLPAALRPGGEGIVAWIAQTFIQLVLLSIIIVGQNVQAAASDKRAESTYEDAEAVLHEALQIQAHLLAQDQILERLVSAQAGPSARGKTT